LLLSAVSRASAQKLERASDYTLTIEEQSVLSRISASSLRGHLAFLASDLLRGRPTPSRGQTIAAEYIAGQFRRAGLEAIGDVGYFQTCIMDSLEPNPEGFHFQVTVSGKAVDIPARHFDMDGIRPMRLDDLPLVKCISESDLKDLKSTLAGMAVITESSSSTPGAKDRRRPKADARDFYRRLSAFNPALLIELDRGSLGESCYFERSVLADAELAGRRMREPGYATVTVSDENLADAFDAMKAGLPEGRVSLHVSSPVKTKSTLRNVVGALRGSDPALRDSYVIVSAHYDGTGGEAGAVGDRIWNAANDDGSGTVSVIELASSLASLERKPLRSVVFLAFFGEELGSLGARYYVEHPLVPIDRTVADLNLEQMGRTDSPDGDMRNRATVTGYGYSDIGKLLHRAGELSGILVKGNRTEPDPFFERSDNLPFAEHGVPSHTICVAVAYPDYHGAGDEWEKIDYDNMALTDRMVARAVLMISQSRSSPEWSTRDLSARRYLDARIRRELNRVEQPPGPNH
jgi:hypothetical protein